MFISAIIINTNETNNHIQWNGQAEGLFGWHLQISHQQYRIVFRYRRRFLANINNINFSSQDTIVFNLKLSKIYRAIDG